MRRALSELKVFTEILTTPHLLYCTHRLTRFHLSSQKWCFLYAVICCILIKRLPFCFIFQSLIYTTFAALGGDYRAQMMLVRIFDFIIFKNLFSPIYSSLSSKEILWLLIYLQDNFLLSKNCLILSQCCSVQT